MTTSGDPEGHRGAGARHTPARGRHTEGQERAAHGAFLAFGVSVGMLIVLVLPVLLTVTVLVLVSELGVVLDHVQCHSR